MFIVRAYEHLLGEVKKVFPPDAELRARPLTDDMPPRACPNCGYDGTSGSKGLIAELIEDAYQQGAGDHRLQTNRPRGAR